jgi:predicted amidohydrolase YtcJ
MWKVDAAYVGPTQAADERVLGMVMERLAQAGITSVQHNNGWTDFLILRRLALEGRLTVRVYDSPPLKSWRRLRDYIAEFGRGDAWMHWGGLKGFGVIDAANYYRWVSEASAAGLQVMAHVGDGELRTLIGIYERVGREQKPGDPRFRIEHGHDLPADLIPVMAKAGIIASWQPPLVLHYAQRTAAGQSAPTNLFPCRSLIDSGVRIAFGSDSQAPAGIVTPLEGVGIAIERGHMTLDEALRAYTRDAAYAEFAEQEKGTLAVGQLADFVLFDQDFSGGARVRIGETKVRLTVVGGRVVYEAK